MKPDEGHNLTEKELAKLERRIASVYGEAAKELQEIVDNYFRQFEKRDAKMKELIGTVVNGKEWTEQDYKQWRLNQIGRGERFKALQKRVAERYTKANQTSVSYVNDATPGIYSLNRNYAAYTIESVAGDVGFDLLDEQTVKRLIKDDPDLMPYYPAKRALNRGIDLAYGKRQISACVTSSILQGKSIKGMADDLQTRIPTMNRTSAIRTARTAVTGAQNAGRIDSYTAAQKMGIKLKKEWLATLDGRTRHSHAMLDGEQVDNEKKFSNGCMFPGDPNGPSAEVYNCRCTLIAAVDGVDTSDAKRRTKDGLIPDMTYAQWEASKRGYSGKQLSPHHKQAGNRAKDVTTKYIQSARPGIGKVRYQTGYNLNSHKAEVRTAQQIRELFGGKIVLLKESNEQGKKTPDYLWKEKGWEQKTISTAKAADSALRGALKQIAENPGGVVFECADQIDIDDLIKQIDDRAFRKIEFDFDVIALRNGQLLFARRYKK